MSLLEIFYWLEYTPLLVEMRSSPWLFPVIATIHLFGLVIIGGSVLVVNLRLLGIGLLRQPAARLARDLQPLLLTGLLIMLGLALLSYGEGVYSFALPCVPLLLFVGGTLRDDAQPAARWRTA